jgi:hypothetical protein
MAGALNLREMLFVNNALLPKATVQVTKYSPITKQPLPYKHFPAHTVFEFCFPYKLNI